MSGHYLRKRTRLGGWAWGLASFSAMLLVVALAMFRLEALDLEGLAYTAAVVAALVVLALALAVVAIGKAWYRGDRGGGRAVAALGFASIIALPFAVGIALALEYPTSTMAETEGLTETAGGAVPVAGLLLGRDFRATAADVYSAARATLEAKGWDVVEVDASRLPQPAEGDLGVSGTVLVPVPTYRDSLGTEVAEPVDPYAASDSDRYTIDAVAYAPLFGFASDVMIRIAEVEGTSFVDMRSASRDVPRDLGQNRRFVESFLSDLDAAMRLLQSGPEAVED